MAFDTDVDFSETRAAEINAIGWVFTGIAIAAVFLKVFSRVESKRAGWDDFFIFFSLVWRSDGQENENGAFLTCYSTGFEYHRDCICLLLGHFGVRETYCCSGCRTWDGALREDSLLANSRISIQHW